MANTAINDFFSDASWDGEYFCIHGSNFESFPSGSSPASTDAREFLYSVLNRMVDTNNTFNVVDQSTKMTFGKRVAYLNNGASALKTYNVNFQTNRNEALAVQDVDLEPLEIVTVSVSDNMDGTFDSEILLVTDGEDDMTSVGILWSQTTTNPTMEDFEDNATDYPALGTTIFTSINPGVLGVWYVRAFAEAYDPILDDNVFVYGDVIAVTVTNTVCLMKGTKITLADGSLKNVENVTYNDELLVWNFDKGELDSAQPVWLSTPQVADYYSHITFADGTELKSLQASLGHRIYSTTHNSFVSPMIRSTPIGTTTVKEDGSLTTLATRKIVKGEGEFYGIITDKHMNAYANGILTSYSCNNVYPMADMKFVKDDRVSRPQSDFPEASNDLYVGLRLAEQPQEWDDAGMRLKRKVANQKPKMVVTTPAPSGN